MVRRSQVLQYITAALQKLAATRSLAIVILNQCASRFQGDRGATIISAVSAGAWEQGISTRLVLFRDWVRKGRRAVAARLVGVQKVDGRATDNLEDFVAFDIHEV